MGDPTKYRADIDGLRAIAILLVIAFHAQVPFLQGGFVGVDVFFVISGFLITRLLLQELSDSGTIALGGFYARRIRRLLPLSALVIASTLIASRWWVAPVDQPDLALDAISAAFYFANWHFALDSAQYMAQTDHSALLHFWSLTVEEQFYLLWPCLLILGWKAARALGRAERSTIGAMMLALASGSLALSVWVTPVNAPLAYFGLHTRAWELLVGAGLAFGGVRLQASLAPRALRTMGWVGMAMIVISAALITPTTIFPGSVAMVPVLGAGFVILAGAGTDGLPVARLLGQRGLVYVGKVSYAWYLWHWPCLVFLAPRSEEHATSVPAILGALALSLVLAVLTHHLWKSLFVSLATSPRETCAPTRWAQR